MRERTFDPGLQTPVRRAVRGTPKKKSDLRARASVAVQRGTEFLFSLQREDFRWCAELESNPTITSEYVFLCQILGIDLGDRRQKIKRYLLKQQNADGSYAIARSWDGDVSCTAETYLALRILGVDQDHPAMLLAQKFILRHGGLEESRIFTRISFAMFGLMPWSSVPVIPPEFILLPPQSPVNLYSLSSWARSTLVPLFIIFHHRPVYALPNGKLEDNDWLDHLWLNPKDKNIPYSSPWINQILKSRGGWQTFFGVADVFLKVYERAKIDALRQKALSRCTQWILEHQEPSGDWAGIFPPMANGVIALTLQGYSPDAEPVQRGLAAIETYSWEDTNGFRMQSCVSPVWDTVLSAIALIDSRCRLGDRRLQGAMRWLLDRQLLVDYGDWKVYRPELGSGGWSFEYFNSWYPDVDDTAAVVIALLKRDSKSIHDPRLHRAVGWLVGMQNRDGGWAAFDVDNDKLFLNDIPFSDMDSLCDPSSPDVTGRVLEAFGLFMDTLRRVGKRAVLPHDLKEGVEVACRNGIEYLRASQEVAGSWFGRWGVNYLYGTSNALCGLARMGVPVSDPMVENALAWLKLVQNPDGGWGEEVASYADKRWMGKGRSTPSQTAWGLMGLLSYAPAGQSVVERGVQWLVDNQCEVHSAAALEGGERVPEARGFSWDEPSFTGTGFPNHFYIRYHLYRHYFPMMALGRYLRLGEN